MSFCHSLIIMNVVLLSRWPNCKLFCFTQIVRSNQLKFWHWKVVQIIQNSILLKNFIYKLNWFQHRGATEIHALALRRPENRWNGCLREPRPAEADAHLNVLGKGKNFVGISPVLWVSNSTHDQKVVSSNLVTPNILDGYGVKDIPGSIPAFNLGSNIKKKEKKI